MKKMLVIEDDELFQLILQRSFSNSMEIDSCYSVKQFYESFDGKQYDIITMGISLVGDKNGLELTRELKAYPVYQNTPILCITAHAFKTDEEKAYESGVDLFITKPVRINELRKHVKNLL